jgi:hypothetical protein
MSLSHPTVAVTPPNLSFPAFLLSPFPFYPHYENITKENLSWEEALRRGWVTPRTPRLSTLTKKSSSMWTAGA